MGSTSFVGLGPQCSAANRIVLYLDCIGCPNCPASVALKSLITSPVVDMARFPNKTQQPQGKCIFCNGKGLSKEHIWSDWLKEIIPRNSAHGNSWAGAWIDPKFQEFKWTKLPREESRQGPVISRKVRNVCKACNNGWISEVVNRAKPILKRLATGQALHLMDDDRSKLIAWLALSTIMQEFANPGTHVIQATDRQFLMENKSPPQQWSIWIGHYMRRELGSFRSYSHSNDIYQERTRRRALVRFSTTIPIADDIVCRMRHFCACIYVHT